MAQSDPNPYQAPYAPAEAPRTKHGQRPGIFASLFMIAAGAFFCVASFWVILGHGVDALLANYRGIGWFPFGFMVFYGCTGGLTALLHLSYLLRGRPQQHLAGLYAIVLGILLGSAAVAVMEFIT